MESLLTVVRRAWRRHRTGAASHIPLVALLPRIGLTETELAAAVDRLSRVSRGSLTIPPTAAIEAVLPEVTGRVSTPCDVAEVLEALACRRAAVMLSR